jgi:hypothetical protein
VDRANGRAVSLAGLPAIRVSLKNAPGAAHSDPACWRQGGAAGALDHGVDGVGHRLVLGAVLVPGRPTSLRIVYDRCPVRRHEVPMSGARVHAHEARRQAVLRRRWPPTSGRSYRSSRRSSAAPAGPRRGPSKGRRAARRGARRHCRGRLQVFRCGMNCGCSSCPEDREERGEGHVGVDGRAHLVQRSRDRARRRRPRLRRRRAAVSSAPPARCEKAERHRQHAYERRADHPRDAQPCQPR